jgi:hypothetical protein
MSTTFLKCQLLMKDAVFCYPKFFSCRKPSIIGGLSKITDFIPLHTQVSL